MMGFFVGGGTAAIVALFVFCIKKLKSKKELIGRILALLLFAIIVLLLSIIFAATAKTNADRESSWALIAFYMMLFGWRIIADAVRLLNKNYETDKPDATDNSASLQQERINRWKEQELKDKEFLDSNNERAKKMLSACSDINAIWNSFAYLDKDNKNSQFRSELYVKALTPELFLDNYYLFKAGNYDDIKDNIYNQRPYLVLDTLIKMGLYIFQTHNNIYCLQYIIDCDEDEFISSKIWATKILELEQVDL